MYFESSQIGTSGHCLAAHVVANMARDFAARKCEIRVEVSNSLIGWL